VFGDTLFVDDSISTTPEATKAALAAYPDRRIALIAGGHERNQDYAELATLLAPRGVVLLVCLPVTGDRLATATYAAAPEIEVLEAKNLQTAMEALSSRRARFDAVILSPGAPSYNQFKNFEERGQAFVAMARKLFGPGS
jgi:UDP-N-acetylmuramoylalanine--D-glutamate ligase